MKANDSVSGTPSHYKGYFGKLKGDGDWDSLARVNGNLLCGESVMTGWIQLLDHEFKLKSLLHLSLSEKRSIQF